MGSESFDFSISGTIEPMQQPSTNTCWATVATMMVSWKDQQNHTIEQVMTKADSNYLQRFQQNKLLDLVNQLPGFLNALNMIGEPPQNPQISTYLNLLQSAGPIWLWTSEISSTPNIMHARILTGMSGDGTDTSTILDLIDPGDGQNHNETFDQFITKFEAEIGATGVPVIQIIHF